MMFWPEGMGEVIPFALDGKEAKNSWEIKNWKLTLQFELSYRMSSWRGRLSPDCLYLNLSVLFGQLEYRKNFFRNSVIISWAFFHRSELSHSQIAPMKVEKSHLKCLRSQEILFEINCLHTLWLIFAGFMRIPWLFINSMMIYCRNASNVKAA